MNYEYYKVFYEVASQESLTHAAEQLFISQSAVSQTISQMERELGVRLFLRQPRGVQLTQEGKILYAHIKESIQAIKAGEEHLKRVITLQDGMLSIAASDTMSEKLLLPYLDQFHHLYPNIKLHINNKTSHDSIQAILSGDVELGFVNLPFTHKDLTFRPILRVHDIFVANPSILKTLPPVMTSQELASKQLIMLETLSNSRRYVDACFIQRGVPLHPETELGAHSLLLHFAQIGLGISCVIKEFSQDYLMDGRLAQVFLAPPLPGRDIALCYLNRITLSTSAQAFLRLLEPLFVQYDAGK